MCTHAITTVLYTITVRLARTLLKDFLRTSLARSGTVYGFKMETDTSVYNTMAKVDDTFERVDNIKIHNAVSIGMARLSVATKWKGNTSKDC